jgi:glutamate formiminotransferase
LRKLVECVPNFSTSDNNVVKTILNEIKMVKQVFLLDYTFDDYYNRFVVSFVGDKNSVLKAAINSAVKAIELIDMNKHKGQHPRIGAVDVVPFIPIEKTNLKDCVRLAKKFGETLVEKCNVPVYLYGEATIRPEGRDLDWIRQGEYENLRENMKKPERKPDFGPPFPHPTAGATITGARNIMVGFNVNLGTSNLQVAKKIAKALHAKKGGLAFVKAMAAEIPQKNMTQIGMSITDFEKTPLHRVFELIKIEAKRYNVPIVGSEFCGLTPLQALIDAVTYYLKIDNLDEERVLEIAVQRAVEKAKKK